ncbi:hypothetical protein PPYR_00167 [Photinus pyralis]|uniref:Neurotransmitter-gated ion-channel ligand-binding domain-containing protein n=2 Tax=Photinus pyralis TaxID=7054 RepID=A0A1Y1LTS9_PHOPY|nr:acetylcholine receptor subunit alpha-like [Photinus pyralis]KAB0803197.1 hypothetical protein PPYR_00167 [Photinus pyralis]
MMKLIVLFITAAIFLNRCNGDEDECKKKTSHLAPIRLKNDILCDYTSNVRPIFNHTNATVVTVKMILKFFTYDMHTNSLSVHNWLSIFWRDDHLKWKPSDYENIKQIHLSNYEIWTPDLSIYNSNDLSSHPSALSSVDCLVVSTGLVVCVNPSRHDALCMADLTKFPFDKQNCSLRYGSWVHSGEEIDFKIPAIPVSTGDYIPNSEWKLLSVSVQKFPGHYNCCPDNTYPSINYRFSIERHSATQAAAVIIPSLVLIIITLTTLWMNPQELDRLCLACCNLIAHTIHIQMIVWQLPSTGDKPPLLIVYSRDSLLLCTFTIVLTVVLKAMTQSAKPSPAWISTVVSGVLSNRPGQWFLLYESSLKSIATGVKEEDTVNIIESNAVSINKDWKLFAKLLDRISFIGFLITYVVMFVTFIV